MEYFGFYLFQYLAESIDHQFFTLSKTVYGNLQHILMGIMTSVFTVYFMLMGFRVVTGEARESMSAIVVRLLKIAAMVGLIGGSILGSYDIQDHIMGVRSHILTAFLKTPLTGSGGAVALKGTAIYSILDTQLDKMAGRLQMVEGVSAGGDVGLSDAKGRALTLGLAGQASPPIVAGLLVLLNEIGMRIAIMLAPIFLFAFIFKRTEDMFYTWVKFMVGSMLSLGVLSMVIGILDNLTAKFADTLYKATALDGFADAVFDSGSHLPQLSESIMAAGFGAIMTVMLLSVPVIVNKFFGSDVGSYSYNTFSGRNQHAGNPLGSASQSASGGGYGGGGGGGDAGVAIGGRVESHHATRAQDAAEKQRLAQLPSGNPVNTAPPGSRGQAR